MCVCKQKLGDLFLTEKQKEHQMKSLAFSALNIAQCHNFE